MTNKIVARKSYRSPEFNTVYFDELGVISTTGSGEPNLENLNQFDNWGADITWEGQ